MIHGVGFVLTNAKKEVLNKQNAKKEFLKNWGGGLLRNLFHVTGLLLEVRLTWLDRTALEKCTRLYDNT